MKRLDLIIPHERLEEVNEILHKHKVGGMSFYDIKGRGRAKREPSRREEMWDRKETGNQRDRSGISHVEMASSSVGTFSAMVPERYWGCTFSKHGDG